MECGQSLAIAPLFDGSNYVSWKRHMCAFLYSIDDSVWTSVEEGWVALDKPKAEWDKTAKFNANKKAVNAIFCGVSLEKFHRISHVETAKKHGTSYRRRTKVLRELRTPNFKCSQLVLKS